MAYPENQQSECLTLLRQPSPLYVDIDVYILEENDQVRVNSEHRYFDGSSRHFGATWSDAERVNTEYGHGLSVLHDIKDHYFWGLDISQMAEFQAICQIQLGRALLNGNRDWRERASEAIEAEIKTSFSGPGGHGYMIHARLAYCPRLNLAQALSALMQYAIFALKSLGHELKSYF